MTPKETVFFFCATVPWAEVVTGAIAPAMRRKNTVAGTRRRRKLLHPVGC